MVKLYRVVHFLNLSLGGRHASTASKFELEERQQLQKMNLSSGE